MSNSIEALWTVQFMTDDRAVNGGVVVFETRRLFGGDSQYYYLGTYQIEGGVLRARLDVVHYHGEPLTAFGDSSPRFSIEVRGERKGDVIDGAMWRLDGVGPKLPLRLQRRAALP